MLVALRATHEHLDLGVLDALTRGSEHLGHVLEKLSEQAVREARAGAEGEDAPVSPLAGWVIVATCNRLEIYLDARRFHDGVELAVQAVCATSGLDAEHVALCLEVATGAPVAEHLYEVTAGLRSIVVGEAEISGQVRAAFERSRAAGHSTAMLNDLFQIGFRHAKKVAASTPLGAAGRSSVAIALDRAETLLGDLSELSVLVIGTGAYARLGVAELVRRGAGDVHVHSASGRAVAFAARHDIEAISTAELPGALTRADLVLACSGRGTSLFPELFLHAGPTVVLDLALHSDLHPLVRHLAEVQVLDLTDLAVEVDDSSRPALVQAREIIAEGVAQFGSRQEFRRVDPAMAAMRRAVDEATAAEVSRLRRSRPDEVADDVERSIRRIMAKVLHSPTARARSLAEEGNADEFVEAFHTIFGIDISADQDDRPTGSVIEDDVDGSSARPGSAVGWMRLDQTVPPQDLGSARRRAADPGELEAELTLMVARNEGTRACPIDLT